jgi:hypothetical protein
MRLGYWLNPWWREGARLDSPQSPEECRQNLERETGVLWDKPILRVLIRRADAVVLRVSHVMVHNAFEMLAVVRLRPGGHGTQVEITFRSQYFTAARPDRAKLLDFIAQTTSGQRYPDASLLPM